MGRPPMPEWATHLQDQRGDVRFDASQYICPVAVNGKLTLSIVDTGAHRTVIDLKMAGKLGLPVRRGAADFGKFSVPGSEAVHAYAGVVEGETLLQVGDKVVARVRNLRVIEHPHAFCLLGADILRGGRPKNTWNFTGLRVHTPEENRVHASLEFEVRGEHVSVPLPHAPAGDPEAQLAVAQVSGGRRLRRDF